MPNEDKNYTSLSASSEDSAAAKTSDADSPNGVDVDSALDADSSNEVDVDSASNGKSGNAPDNASNSASNGRPDSTPESTPDNTSDAGNATPQHPHRKRNIAIGVIIAVVVVAAIAIILAFAHSWDAGSTDTSDTSSENTQQADDQQVEKAGDSSNAEGGESTESEEPAGTNEDANNNNSDDSSDTSTNNVPDSSAEEEWPGQSLGYIGPNGEGAIKPDDYETNDEYIKALDSKVEQVENEAPWDYVEESGGGGYYSGRICVRFYRTCSEYDAHQIVEDFGGIWVSDDYGIDRSNREDWSRAWLYFPNATSRSELEQIADEFSALPEVKSAGLLEDGIRFSEGENSNASYDIPKTTPSEQYYLDCSGFYNAWTVVKCNRTVEIAVIDSGFDLDHPDLASNMTEGIDASKGGALLADDYADGDGHGTMVAGVASAVVNNSVGIDGASYNASVIPVRIQGDSGERPWCYVVCAFEYLLDLPNLPEVINMSFEGLYMSDETQDELEALIAQARAEGIVCVAASGNWHADREDEPSPDMVKYPAALAGVLSVGSVDSSQMIAWDSNRNEFVDLCASGVSIYTTANPHSDNTSHSLYAYASGTSFAAPQVSAAAALLKAQHPTWSAERVENQLKSTSLDLGDVGRDNSYGYGLLDAAAAVGYTDSGSGGGSGSGSGSSGGTGDAYWSEPAAPVSVGGYLSTYAVRDGGAGPDFLGISNTNFDFTVDNLSSDQHSGYTAADLAGVKGAGLAIWATSVNENPNPYYVNLYYNTVMGTSYRQVISWPTNPR